MPLPDSTLPEVPLVQLSIFHVRAVVGARREFVLRAYSFADAAGLVAGATRLPIDQICDDTRFRIDEVNYGQDFLMAGGRGIIAQF